MNIIDDDMRFEIDTHTRTVKYGGEDKVRLIQGDHKSERITFEMDRYVEQHDMLSCSEIKIHFNNINLSTKEKSEDVYTVDDASVGGSAGKLVFSWLISKSTTMYEGSVSFAIEFKDVDEDGNITYRWSTAKNSEIIVGEGMNCNKASDEKYSDLLSRWKAKVTACINRIRKDCYAGARGYYYSHIDLTNKKIYLSAEQVLPQLGEGEVDTSFETPEYEIGNGISLVNSNKYDYLGRCSATIKSITNNVLEYDGDVGFTKIYNVSDFDIDDYTLYVPDQPDIGIADVREGAASIGTGTSSTGSFAFAVNRDGGAHGNFSFTSGRGCRANYCADAGGYKTKANGQQAFTRGSGTEANADNASAIGNGTQATTACQVAQGKFNIVDELKKFAHIVGNGTSKTKRSNAYTLDWEGNGWFANDVQFGNISMKELITPQMHSRIFRGKCLGSVYTEAQQAAVEAGTFDDLFLGDYWEINGYKWRIVDIDYWYGTGHLTTTPHHLVIMPDAVLGRAVMNDTYSTEGGYVGSKMYTSTLPEAKGEVDSAFPDKVWGHEEYLVNEVDNGKPINQDFYTSYVDLPNEIMMYGTKIWACGSDGTGDLALATYCKTQLSLFNVAPYYIQPVRNANSYWLRDAAAPGGWAYVDNMGRAGRASAQVSEGIRPVFAIC